MKIPLIPKIPKYPRYGLSDVFQQGKQSLSLLLNPSGKPRRKRKGRLK